MARGFRVCDRDMDLLLPPSIQDWVPDDHVVHTIVLLAEQVPLQQFEFNRHRTGSEQYHPQLVAASVSAIGWHRQPTAFGALRRRRGGCADRPVRSCWQLNGQPCFLSRFRNDLVIQIRDRVNRVPGGTYRMSVDHPCQAVVRTMFTWFR